MESSPKTLRFVLFFAVCLYLLEDSSVAFEHLYFFITSLLFLSDDLFLLTTFSHCEQLLYLSLFFFNFLVFQQHLLSWALGENMNNKDCKHQFSGCVFFFFFSAFRDEIISVADSVFYSLRAALLPPTSTCTTSFCKVRPWLQPTFSTSTSRGSVCRRL